MAYNCVTNSPIAQTKLFMRPSDRKKDAWLYCEYILPNSLRSPTDRQIIAQSFDSSMEAYRKMLRPGEMAGMAKWVSVVTLCPLLELDDSQEISALGRLQRKGWQEGERVNLTRLPAENTKYRNMVLTEPPCYEVHAELTYKHSLEPQLMIRAKRHIISKSYPLTIGAVLSSACRRIGDVYLHEPPMASNGYSASHRSRQRFSIDGMIFSKVREHGGSFALDLTNSQFVFRNRQSGFGLVVNRIVVPSAEERLDLEVSRIQ